MPLLIEAGLHWLCLPCRVKPFTPNSTSTTTELISSYSQTVTKTLPPSPKMAKPVISESIPNPPVRMDDTNIPPSLNNPNLGNPRLTLQDINPPLTLH